MKYLVLSVLSVFAMGVRWTVWAAYTPVANDAVVLQKLYDKIDAIAEKDPWRLQAILQKLIQLSASKSERLTFLISEIVDYIKEHTDLLKDADGTGGAKVDLMISTITQTFKDNAYATFDVTVKNLWTKDFDKKTAELFCTEYTTETNAPLNSISLAVTEFLGAKHQQEQVYQITLPHYNANMFTIKCEIDTKNLISESDETNNSVIW